MTANRSQKIMQRPHSWGFVAFLICAVIAALVASQRREESTDSQSSEMSAVVDATPGSAIDEAIVTEHPPAAAASADTGADVAVSLPRAVSEAPQSAASIGEITFGSSLVVTSEGAIAAVFVLKRSPALSGRALVQWEAISGTADAAIDFSDASGTVEFSDGEASRAIYVPLRNDLLKEENETFKVCLHSPQRARLRTRTCAEATIRDND